MKESELIQKAIKWINSPEGKQKLKDSYDRSVKITDSLDKARIINPDSLKRPITI